MFFVRSGEQSFCPCCSGQLKVAGSRRRKYINDLGDIVVLVIRRLRCSHCNRLHHELPDILVPYKRHGSASIEAVITGKAPLTVTADDATIRRWRNWFMELTDYFLGCLESIAVRYGKKPVEEAFRHPSLTLRRIRHHVGDAPGWLARIVRPLANANLWVHTRSAFLS